MIYVEVFGGGGFGAAQQGAVCAGGAQRRQREPHQSLSRCPGAPEELKDRLLYVMHNREDFKLVQRRLAQFPPADPIQRAGGFLPDHTAELRGNGKQFCAVARSMWAGFPAIDRVAGRLQGVTLEIEDFETTFQRYDSPNTHFYLDPPYVFTEDYYPGNIFQRKDHARLAASCWAPRACGCCPTTFARGIGTVPAARHPHRRS